MADCSTSPIAITEWRTAFVNGQGYLGNTVTATIFGPTLLTYTFPQLLLTALQPGVVITQVRLIPPCFLLTFMKTQTWIINGGGETLGTAPSLYSPAESMQTLMPFRDMVPLNITLTATPTSPVPTSSVSVTATSPSLTVRATLYICNNISDGSDYNNHTS